VIRGARQTLAAPANLPRTRPPAHTSPAPTTTHYNGKKLNIPSSPLSPTLRRPSLASLRHPPLPVFLPPLPTLLPLSMAAGIRRCRRACGVPPFLHGGSHHRPALVWRPRLLITVINANDRVSRVKPAEHRSNLGQPGSSPRKPRQWTLMNPLTKSTHTRNGPLAKDTVKPGLTVDVSECRPELLPRSPHFT
jgi:hypothetical protein